MIADRPATALSNNFVLGYSPAEKVFITVAKYKEGKVCHTEWLIAHLTQIVARHTNPAAFSRANSWYHPQRSITNRANLKSWPCWCI